MSGVADLNLGESFPLFESEPLALIFLSVTGSGSCDTFSLAYYYIFSTRVFYDFGATVVFDLSALSGAALRALFALSFSYFSASLTLMCSNIMSV